MIGTLGKIKPHLVAVHLDKRAEEYAPAVRLWRNGDKFQARVCVSSGYHPNPFGREGIEIISSDGRIPPGALPPEITEPDFVMVGGLLSESACLLRAFTSLSAMGYYSAGRVRIRLPLDGIYARPGIDKPAFARERNVFAEALDRQFEGAFGASFDGVHLFGEPDSPARLEWISSSDGLLG